MISCGFKINLRGISITPAWLYALGCTHARRPLPPFLLPRHTSPLGGDVPTSRRVECARCHRRLVLLEARARGVHTAYTRGLRCGCVGVNSSLSQPMSERATDNGACPRCEQVCRLFEYSGAGLRVQCDCVWECVTCGRSVIHARSGPGAWPSWANRVRGVDSSYYYVVMFLRLTLPFWLPFWILLPLGVTS